MLRNSLQLAVMNVSNLAGLFFFSILLARLLGIETLGFYSLLSALLMPFVYSVDFGQSNALVLEIGQSPSRIAEIVGNALVTKVLLGAGATSLLILFSLAFFELKSEREIFWLFGLLILPRALYLTLEAGLRAKQQMLAPMLTGLVCSGLLLAGGLLLLTAGCDFKAIVIFLISLEILKALIIFLFYRKMIKSQSGNLRPFAFNGQTCAKSLQRALPFFITGILGILYYRVDIWLLDSMADRTEVGVFAAAGNFVKLLRVIPSVIVAAFFPMISDIADSMVNLKKITRKTLLIQILTNSVFALIIFIGADLFISMTYDIERSIAILKIFVWSVIPLGVYSTLIYVFFRLGKAVWNLRILGAAILLNVCLNYWLIPDFGAAALGMSSLVSETFCSIAFALLFFHFMKTKAPHLAGR